MVLGDIAKVPLKGKGALHGGELAVSTLRNKFRDEFIEKFGERAGHQVHHVLPVSLRTRFAALGIDFNDSSKWGSYWPKDSHQKLAWAYNAEWSAWLDAHKNATEADALEFAHTLAERYPFIWP